MARGEKYTSEAGEETPLDWVLVYPFISHRPC